MRRKHRPDWSDLPPVMRRLMWWWAVVIVFLPLYILLTIVIRPWWLKWLVESPLVGVVAFLPQFAVMAVLAFKARRLRRTFNESGGRLCTTCGHSLKGLSEKGRCPECGAPYDEKVDQATWRNAGMELSCASWRAPADGDREVPR